MKEQVINLLAEILEIEENDLTEETILDDLEQWDSMAKLSLIVVMSDEFCLKATSSDIKKFKQVKDIIKFITNQK